MNFIFNINIQSQQLSGYNYFTNVNFIVSDIINDPIGNIYLYFALMQKRLDGNRLTLFNHFRQSC